VRGRLSSRILEIKTGRCRLPETVVGGL
jgi:hypothetical protein